MLYFKSGLLFVPRSVEVRLYTPASRLSRLSRAVLSWEGGRPDPWAQPGLSQDRSRSPTVRCRILSLSWFRWECRVPHLPAVTVGFVPEELQEEIWAEMPSAFGDAVLLARKVTAVKLSPMFLVSLRNRLEA